MIECNLILRLAKYFKCDLLAICLPFSMNEICHNVIRDIGTVLFLMKFVVILVLQHHEWSGSHGGE